MSVKPGLCSSHMKPWTVPLRRVARGAGGCGIQTFSLRLCCLLSRKQKLNANQNKMGASLDTPARCPLCNELTGDPVTLKCNHRFCQRCIGDLWSVTPNGPYHCPEWRCKTVYRTLPFDSSLILPPSNSRRAPPRSSAGTINSGLLLQHNMPGERLQANQASSNVPGTLFSAAGGWIHEGVANRQLANISGFPLTWHNNVKY